MTATAVTAELAGDHGYAAPASLVELAALLASASPSPLFLAGGQSLVPSLRTGKAGAGRLVDLRRVPELRGISIDGGTLSIGAMTTFADLHANEMIARSPILSQALSYVGNHTIRNRATVGGNLAWADPRAELPLALMLCRADVVTNRRTLPIDALPVAPFRSALERRELILRIEIEAAELLRPSGFLELLDRNSIGKAVVSAGAIRLDDGDLGVGVGGIVDRPVTARLPFDRIERWIDGLEQGHTILADPFHSFSYRKSMAKLLLRRLCKALDL